MHGTGVKIIPNGDVAHIPPYNFFFSLTEKLHFTFLKYGCSPVEVFGCKDKCI